MMMIAGGEAFGRWKVIRAEPSWNESSVLLMKKVPGRVLAPSATWGNHEKSATPNGSFPGFASSLQKSSKCLLFISHPACGAWHSSLSTLRQTMCSYWLLNWTLKFCDIKMPIYCWRQFIWKNDEICIFTNTPGESEACRHWELLHYFSDSMVLVSQPGVCRRVLSLLVKWNIFSWRVSLC